MRVVIAGGGTGGHVFPGIAVAEEFKRRSQLAEVVFIGTEHGIEGRTIPRYGYPLRFISVEGFIGKSPLKKLRAVIRLFGSLLYSKKLLKALKPDIVIGTGGYASFPPTLMASLISIPTIIMEQNLIPGMANRLLGKFVSAIAVTYHESISFFPRSKTHLTGNPVRLAIVGANRNSAYKLFSLAPDKFTVVILGGSSGSRTINNVVVNSLNLLIDLKEDIQFLHQTGELDYETVRKAYRNLSFKGTVAPFLHEIAEAYAVADLVISRAGATTLAELTAGGKPAILIPYPYAAGHQEFNARKLQEVGACRVILEHELQSGILAKNIREIYLSPDIRSHMRKQSLTIGRPDAAERVVDIALSLMNLSKGVTSNV